MERPVRVAFCKILFASRGGTFDEKGMPRFGVTEGKQLDRAIRVRGRCDRAYDCGECPLLHEWLKGLVAEGWSFGWECVTCLKATEEADAAAGGERRVQGFYQSGRRKDLPPDDIDYDPDRPGLEGCTRCGRESSFLQLVLRRGL